MRWELRVRWELRLYAFLAGVGLFAIVASVFKLGQYVMLHDWVRSAITGAIATAAAGFYTWSAQGSRRWARRQAAAILRARFSVACHEELGPDR